MDEQIESLLREVSSVVNASAQRGQRREIEVLVEMTRAKVIMELGNILAQVVYNHRQAEAEIAPLLANPQEIVLQTADCFRAIALREWLSEASEPPLGKTDGHNTTKPQRTFSGAS